MDGSIAYQSIVSFFMFHLVGIHNDKHNHIYMYVNLNKQYFRITWPNDKQAEFDGTAFENMHHTDGTKL